MATTLNHFNFKTFEGDVLVTNDQGKYLFLSPTDFRSLVTSSVPAGSKLFSKLKSDMFVTDEDYQVFCERVGDDTRRAKGYLFNTTSLFIFVVTNRCNSACVYCQAQTCAPHVQGDMSVQVAHRAVDIALASPNQEICIEFQGGEPLLNFPVIQETIRYCDARNAGKKLIRYSIVSNLILLTDEILRFLKEHHVSLSTSIDGDAELHNANRPLRSGQQPYEKVLAALSKVRGNGLDIGAIQTTTRRSLAAPCQVIDAYVALGFRNVFLRPLTQLGRAREVWDEIGYSAEQFVQFYASAMNHVLQINRAGTLLSETHAVMFLRKILRQRFDNYMELRSPCGAVTGQMAFNVDGSIYTCDEGRMVAAMGNNMFRLGSVESATYEDLLNSPVATTVCSASILESIPQCCECVYSPYCGVCPVASLANCGSIFPTEPNSFRCKSYRGMLDFVFHILHRNDPEDMRVLESWL